MLLGKNHLVKIDANVIRYMSNFVYMHPISGRGTYIILQVMSAYIFNRYGIATNATRKQPLAR